MVIISIKIMVRPEKRKELLQTLDSIIEQVGKESGCLHAGVYQDVGNENNLMVIEEWATQEDADVHVRSNIFLVLIGAGNLMHHPPAIVIHAVDRSTTLH